MASKKKTKSTVKKAKKLAKKNPKAFVALVVIALIAVGVVFALWKMGIISFEPKQEGTKTEEVYTFDTTVKSYLVEYDSESNKYLCSK